MANPGVITTAGEATKRPASGQMLSSIFSKYGIFLIFIAMVVAASILSPAFLSSINLINIVRQMSVVGLIALGVTGVIVSAGIDLSSGSVVGLTAVVAASLAQDPEFATLFYPGVHVPVIVAVLAACAASAVLITAAAKAQPARASGDVVTVVVPTRGLDLAQPKDRSQLRHRVDVAVRQLCGDPAPQQLDRWMLRQACREAAFRNAAPQVDALVRRERLGRDLRDLALLGLALTAAFALFLVPALGSLREVVAGKHVEKLGGLADFGRRADVEVRPVKTRDERLRSRHPQGVQNIVTRTSIGGRGQRKSRTARAMCSASMPWTLSCSAGVAEPGIFRTASLITVRFWIGLPLKASKTSNAT